MFWTWLQDKIEELENARLANLDVDARTEIEKARKETKAAKMDASNVKKEKENVEIQLAAKDQKVSTSLLPFDYQRWFYRPRTNAFS